jgi:hypothetical protein
MARGTVRLGLGALWLCAGAHAGRWQGRNPTQGEHELGEQGWPLVPEEREFIEVEGTLFYEGRHAFRYLGANCYWLMAEASYGARGRANVRAVLDHAVSLGVRVIRTWAFADGPAVPHLQPAAGRFDEGVFDALDFVVAEARARKLRLLLPLLNYWTDYGGAHDGTSWACGLSTASVGTRGPGAATPP